MEDDDTASSPPPAAAMPDRRRRRPAAVLAGAAPQQSAADTARARLFTPPGPAPSLGVPSSASQDDAYNTGQRVAKKRKGLGMPDSFDRLTVAFQTATEGLSASQQGSTREQILAAEKMAQDTNATFLKVNSAPQFCKAFACLIASLFCRMAAMCVAAERSADCQLTELTVLMRWFCRDVSRLHLQSQELHLQRR